MLVIGADDDPIRLHEIVDRSAFLEEFGIRRDGVADVDPSRRKRFGDRRAHAIGRADGNRRFVDDERPLLHPPPDVARSLEHVAHVGTAVFIGRCTHGDELHGCVVDGGIDIGREMQPTCLNVAMDQRLEPGLVDRHAAALQELDLACIDIDAQHVVADFGETRPGDEPDVARTDHGDLHAGFPRLALISASAAIGSAAAVMGRPTTR